MIIYRCVGLGLEVVSGRDYNTAIRTDSNAYLINEKAAERLGWDNPIGKKLSYGGYAEGRVIGVVKDFNFAALHEPIEPLVMQVASRPVSNIFVRIEGENLREQVQTIKSEWEALGTSAPFEFTFLDAEIQRLYKREQRLSKIFIIFSCLAICIACLGLFGLVTFMLEQRVKEIGIRKVLGASIFNIIRLISVDYLKLVLIAFLIAMPIAWYCMQEWLQNFAYQVSIKWLNFLLAGLAACIIALITVSFQSLKAALSNPIHALRQD